MAEPVQVEISGLQLSNNTFSASPPGSLLLADNIVMPQKGVAEPRRGQARAYLMPLPQQIPLALTEFKGTLIANYATDKFDDYGLGIAANPTVGFSGAPFNPVDSNPDSADYGRMKFGFAGSYLSFCTTTGPKVLETLSGPPRSAGLLRMPDSQTLLPVSRALATGWLPYNSSVAYRTVSRRETSDGTSLLSPPSGRAVITNRILAPVAGLNRTVASTTTVTVTIPAVAGLGLSIGDTFTLSPGESNFPAGTYAVTGFPATNKFTYADAHASVNASSTVAEDFNTGARATDQQIPLAPDLVADDFVRIYRSKATSSSSVQPSDEMFLVGEHRVTAGDIALGAFDFQDTTPESVISDPLYTNPQTGEGAAQINGQPPLYRDIAFWNGRVWYANTTGLQTLRLQMLGVGSPDGIQDGDTLTINTSDFTATTFTFLNSPATDTDVQIVSDGTPSQNIQATAQNLCNAIAVVFAVDVPEPLRAYYNSAQDEAPGKVLLQGTTYEQGSISGDGQFSVTASRPATWVPSLSNSTATLSDNGRVPNGLSYSKPGQPEAVPAVNFTSVGSKNYPIARILALQQALLVFKEGDGIYALTGQSQFQVQQISTANIIAPDCCAVFADAAWVYTDQGILRISDSGGATVVSRPIETELNRLRALMPTETRNWSFTVTYETERRIMFFVPFSGDEELAPPTLKAYCYNNATQSWTGPLDYGRPYSGTVGVIGNQLALGVYDSPWATGRVTTERKSMDASDYADASFSNSITSLSSNPLVIRLGSKADVEPGDGIVQGNFATKIKQLRPDIGSRYVEVYEDIPWSVASCTIYKHYDVALQFQPFGNPTGRKALTRLTWLAKPDWFSSLAGTTTLMTDQVQANLEIPTPFPGFGSTAFGSTSFGDRTPMTVDVNPVAPQWVNAAQFLPGFELSEVWPQFKLQGFSYMIESATAPTGRGR